MWTSILIISLVAAMAVGPIMWFRSTPSQRRIVGFRNRAAQLGLRVRIVSLRDLLPSERDSAETVAGYGLPWVRSGEDGNGLARRPANHPWRLIKERISHEGHFQGYWNWQEGMVADSKWHDPLRAMVSDLPPDAVALENNAHGLWLYWRERGAPEAVDRLAATLESLKRYGAA
ncbi:hypothetical protein ACXYTJ_01680 [Gilvimarinus sp. F26214L]|uniref:hypothetical protein n=1 Tax=Gilvimarinus sp. DZF01 TaxID=3461371 RepID=UPI00404645E2